MKVAGIDNRKGVKRMRFSGKCAVVTGAASGIGLAVAQRLAAEGAAVVIGDRNAEGVEAAAAGIGGGATAVTLDVADEASCAAMIDRAVAQHGGIDILCNIAGVLEMAPFADMDAARWSRILDINLGGVYHMSRAALPHLLERRGNIVNMASSAGLVGVPFNTAYCASKHAVVGLTKALALELSKQGVRVNAVCPGGVRTGMTTLAAAPPADIDWAMVMRGTVAWLNEGALCDPEDIANAVVFLASDEARQITGTAFSVDGGQTAS